MTQELSYLRHVLPVWPPVSYSLAALDPQFCLHKGAVVRGIPGGGRDLLALSPAYFSSV